MSGGSFGVTIGGAPATSVVRTSATQITAVTPAGTAGAQDVVITNNDGQTVTGTGAYTYQAAPIVISVSPTTGTSAGGTSVIITGTGFTGVTAVKFGSTSAASYTVNSATQITAISPVGSAGIVDITVTTPGGTSALVSGDKYDYFTILIFKTVNTTTVTVPSGATNVDYLVVGGGGGGGRYGGGGGAGGYLTGTLTGLSGSQPVTVGAGGTAGAASGTGQGGIGGNSVFASITATGGGGGGSNYTTVSTNRNGINGGSGGGAVGTGSAVGTGTSGLGYNGGAGVTTTAHYYGGGGGGASLLAVLPAVLPAVMGA